MVVNVLILVVFYAHCAVLPFPEPKGNPDPSKYLKGFGGHILEKKIHFINGGIFGSKMNDKHFAFVYSISACPEKGHLGNCKKTNGTYASYAFVNQSAHYQKSLKFNENRFVSKDKDSFLIAIDDDFSITPIDDNHYVIRGKMEDKNIWVAGGDLPRNLKIEWEFMIERKFGYAQKIFEDAMELINTGIILWNTYGHTSRVLNGTLRMGDEIIHFEDGKPGQYIAYCDQNWGTLFPENPPGKQDPDFAWGWYVAHYDGRDFDFSIACGIGQFTSRSKLLGTMGGNFCDLRSSTPLPTTKKNPNNEPFSLSTRMGFFRKGEKLEEHAQSSTDGRCLSLDVYRSDWRDVVDDFGTARIPFSQSVHVVTEKYDVWLNLTTREEKRYNRLLFPFNGDVFSDFEGLGADAWVRVSEREGGKVLREFVVKKSAGVEYGYKFNVTNVPV